ncbi:uncharacterized protein MKZ38_009927 [Zalerion maritima]|uniref:Peptide hydrolase n=1 Tax=Zalerion maritima TaxID=339359 RepID=A0AAD5RT04_9PEZI|nr:uncharacterized protein MKZ38_009927 [Zalerion maritima]
MAPPFMCSLLFPLFLAVLSIASGYTPISDDTLKSLPVANDDFNIETGSLLSPLLITRVPGTGGQVEAQNHIASFFQENLPEWSVSWHNTTDTTPLTEDEEIPFQNIIVRRDPPWAAEGDVGRLTLVAHYDSKVEPEGFIGAIDSAAPCAMLMHVARSLEEGLKHMWAEMEENGEAGDPFTEVKGVQILFLDGEEAWETWTRTDSLYGARSLAEYWDTTPHAAMSAYRNPLNSISLFVLLDLLGTANPRIPSYFQNTHWAYKKYASMESRLRNLHLLTSKPASGTFLPDKDKKASDFSRGFVEDDHVPFMRRGVPVLHLIPTPFPSVWHTLEDDGEHLDIDTVKDWAQITLGFAAEWMDLEGHMPTTKGRRADRVQVERGADEPKTKTEL